jgi:hypothetical protein
MAAFEQNDHPQAFNGPYSVYSGGQGIRRRRNSQALRSYHFSAQTLSRHRFRCCRLSPVVAEYLALLGIILCAFCAQSLCRNDVAIYLTAALPIVATVSSIGGTRKAASYCRYSSKNQNERTIADQQRDCRNRASQDDIELPRCFEFSDEAVSGAKRKRDGFNQMLAAARAGQISVLYLVNLSRLARDCLLCMLRRPRAS